MEGGHLGLHAVEDLARETAIRQQLGERYKIRVAIELALLQIGGTDFRALTGEFPEILLPAFVLHCFQQHAMGGRTERHRDLLAFEIGELVIRRVFVYHQTIARTVGVIGDDCDQFALGFRTRLEGCAIHQQRVVAHHADLQLVGDHAVGHGRAGGEVLPVQLELDVLVFAGLGNVFVEQTEFFDHDAAGDGVGGRVLYADADRDNFRERSGVASHGQHQGREWHLHAPG